MATTGSGTETAIEGVKVIPLKTFSDERGAVCHMLKSTDPHFIRFGEIYFSKINKGATKAWKNHRTVTANYACVSGEVRFVMYDGRDDSPSSGKLVEVTIGPDNYALIIVPPGVWNGFHGLGDPDSIVASCATETYDPAEFEGVDPNSNKIPYQWPVSPASRR